MPQIAAIVINDGKATPVAHTFSPVHVKDGVASYADRVSGIQVGFPTITSQLRDPVGKSRINKVLARVDLPVLEQTSPSTTTGIQPAPMKAFALTMDVVAMLPERSTPEQRADILAFFLNYVNSAVFKNHVLTYDRVYG